MKIVLIVLLSIILSSLLSNALFGTFVGIQRSNSNSNSNSYNLAFADDSTTSDGGDTKDTQDSKNSGETNSDNGEDQKASSDKTEKNSKNSEKSLETGKLQVNVKLDKDPIYSGKENVSLLSTAESSNQSSSLTQLVLPQGNGPANTTNNDMPLFSVLALDTSGPIVTSTDPTNDAIGVPVNKLVTATFNETVDPVTVNSSTFILQTGTTTVPGSVSLSENNLTATFTPSQPLASNTLYVATLTTGVKDKAGNNLQQQEVWSFTTVDIPPPPPDTVIDSAIDGNGDEINDGEKTDSDTMSFIFSSSRPNSTFQCSRDGKSFKECDNSFTHSSSSFQSYFDLKDGKHKFKVAATSAGVEDPSPAKFSWTVKTVATIIPPIETVPSSNISPLISPLANGSMGTGQISPGNNNITIEVPGYGNVSLEFANLTAGGNITVQALLSTAELQNTGIQSNIITGLKRISMPDSQLFTLVGTVFNISSVDASFTGPIKVSIPYNNTLLSQISSAMPVDPGSQIRFLHYDGATWNDETSGVNAISTHVMGSINNLGLVVAAVRPSVVPTP